MDDSILVHTFKNPSSLHTSFRALFLKNTNLSKAQYYLKPSPHDGHSEGQVLSKAFIIPSSFLV